MSITWQAAAAMNALIAMGYFAICGTIVRGLLTTHQLRSNPLAVATAAIFFTCAVHHGAHTVHMLLPVFGIDPARALRCARRSAGRWSCGTSSAPAWRCTTCRCGDRTARCCARPRCSRTSCASARPRRSSTSAHC